jgi:hypothetical protein
LGNNLSNSSCASQDVDNEDEFENSNVQKHFNINSYSKEDFMQALVALKHHIEDQEVLYKKLNKKTASTDLLLDEDFEVATLIFDYYAVDAAQEAVLDLVTVAGVDNETIELTDQNDTSILTMQSKLQDKNDQQDHVQRLLSQDNLLQLLDNCNAPLHLFIHKYDFEQPAP